jgi:hypothetical protein
MERKNSYSHLFYEKFTFAGKNKNNCKGVLVKVAASLALPNEKMVNLG